MSYDYSNLQKFIGKKPEFMRELVKNESQTWYYLPEGAITMPMTDLTEKGLRIYEEMRDRANTETPKYTFVKGKLIPQSAGVWVPDKNSDYYTSEDFAYLNSMTNLVLEALDEDDIQYQTSVVLWRGRTSKGKNWVITKSGSLYFYDD